MGTEKKISPRPFSGSTGSNPSRRYFMPGAWYPYKKRSSMKRVFIALILAEFLTGVSGAATSLPEGDNGIV
jgi:hypothetical protein